MKLNKWRSSGDEHPNDFSNAPGTGRDFSELTGDLGTALSEMIKKNAAHWEKAASGKASQQDLAKIGKDVLSLVFPGPRLGSTAAKVGLDTLFPKDSTPATKPNKKIADKYHGSRLEKTLDWFS